MTGQAGYTATEALAALAILGLAVGGLTAGLHVLGKEQSAAGVALRHAAILRVGTQQMARVMGAYGPFRSDRPADLHGDSAGFTFVCGQRICGVRVEKQTLVMTADDGVTRTSALPKAKSYAFSYLGPLGASDIWPAVLPPPPAPQWEVLQAVRLTADDQPILTYRVWVAQRADCDFDAISQDCRVTP